MAGQSSRGNPRLSDIVRSVAVLGGGVLLIFLAAQLVFSRAPSTPNVPAVDYEAVVVGVQREAPYAVLTPATLPTGWKATSARYRQEVWSLGVLTDDVHFVGLTQAVGDEDDVVADHAEGSERDGEVDVDGTTWTRWTTGDEVTFSRVVEPEQDGQQPSTVVVTSDVPRATLESYVGSLAPS